MANHLCGNKQKHNKNYIMYHMNDPRGACLTKDQVMDISEEEDNKGTEEICFLNAPVIPPCLLTCFTNNRDFSSATGIGEHISSHHSYANRTASETTRR